MAAAAVTFGEGGVEKAVLVGGGAEGEDAGADLLWVYGVEESGDEVVEGVGFVGWLYQLRFMGHVHKPR